MHVRVDKARRAQRNGGGLGLYRARVNERLALTKGSRTRKLDRMGDAFPWHGVGMGRLDEPLREAPVESRVP